jgi:hypothetical protein
MQHLWLPLLMVFVLYATVCHSVCRAESQYQEIELGSGYAPDSSADDRLTSGIPPVKYVNNLLLVMNAAEQLSVVSGSDAYPSSILLGPPVINTSA